MDIINMLLAAGVDPSPELNMHRPSRGGNSGRFIDPLLNTGCTPLLRATMASDMDVVRALLSKGANPNINAMGLTPFLVAAGVGTGTRGGTGLAAQSSAGGAVNVALMDLLLQHGADVNAQVTGTKTYSMRIARAPSANEGMTALHVAAQAGRVDLVRYLLDKGASTEIADASGRKAIDLAGPAARDGGTPAPPAGSANPGTPAAPPVAEAGPAAAGGGAAEIRALLANAASKK
jgi:ankyrin repeat protein